MTLRKLPRAGRISATIDGCQPDARPSCAAIGECGDLTLRFGAFDEVILRGL